MNAKKLILGMVVVAAAVLANAPRAQAAHRGLRYAYSAYYPSVWTTYYSAPSYGYSYSGYHGRWGHNFLHFLRPHYLAGHRHRSYLYSRRHVAYYSYPYYYSAYYPSWYGCYSPPVCCESTIRSEVKSDDLPLPPSIDKTPAKPVPKAEKTSLRTASNLTADSILMTVRVPSQAKIFINDRLTTSLGTVRQYITRQLGSGMIYTYNVRAEITRDGRTITQTRTMQLKAGQHIDLAFDFNAPAVVDQHAVTTTLIVHVPEDAKVYLGESPTRSIGSVRRYVTKNLTSGQQWDNYLVRAQLERGGQTVSLEQKISLVAGETRTLKFDFDTSKVVAATP